MTYYYSSEMEAMDMSEALRVLDSSLTRTNWRFKASSKRRLQTDILALCTGMRPVIMIDYGGKMPELRDRLCAFLKLSQEESSVFENLRVMVIEDMIYLICVRGLAELIKLTVNKELELHFVDLEQDPPKMVTEVEKISIGAQFISLQKLFFTVFCEDATDDGSDCRLRVDNQPSHFIDLSHFMQDTPVTVPTLNGWLLGYPVVYIFGKDHIQDAVYNLSTKSLNLFSIFVRSRDSTSSKRPPQEELMSFSVPYELSIDGDNEVWAVAFLARMKARWENCKHVWGSLRMEVSATYPQAIAL